MKVTGSLRSVVLLASALLISLSLAAGFFVSEYVSYQNIRNDILEKVRFRLNFFQVVIEGNSRGFVPAELQKIVSSFSFEEDLSDLLIINPTGQIMASNRLSDVGLPIKKALPGGSLGVESYLVNERKFNVWYDNKTESVNGYVNVCHMIDKTALRSKQCGLVFYKVNLLFYYRQLDGRLYVQLAITSFCLVLSMLVIFAAVKLIIIDKINEIINFIQRFSDGERGIRAELKGLDEIEYFSKSINDLFIKTEINEDKISDTAKRLHSIVDTAVDAIITISEKGIVETFNAAAERLFQYDKNEIIGKNISILMDVAYSVQHDKYIENYLLTGEKKIIGIGREVTAKRKNGEVFPMELAISEMVLHDKKMFTGIIRDVSERSMMQASLVEITKKLQASNLELKRHNRTDFLTGLSNRAYFDLVLNEELRRATRYAGSVSLIMCDVDYFKKYNDTLGHQAGDQCLSKIGSILMNYFMRAGELPARYGGEEFVVIMPDIIPGQALKRAEEFCQAVRDAAIPHLSSHVTDIVTVSIGIATYQASENSKHPPNIEVLIEAADKALYESKQNGRNRVTAGKMIED